LYREEIPAAIGISIAYPQIRPWHNNSNSFKNTDSFTNPLAQSFRRHPWP